MGFKTETFDTEKFEVEYEILPAFEPESVLSDSFIAARRAEIQQEMQAVDTQLDAVEARVAELNAEIDRLTNHADGVDYAIAVASGVLTGLIDSFFVGEVDFKKLATDGSGDSKEGKAKAAANKTINQLVKKYAKFKGYEGEELQGAVSFLARKYPVPQDNTWAGKGLHIAPANHHLADIAHHPTLLGLIAAIVVQFLRVGVFVDRNGELHLLPVKTSAKEMMKILLPVIISGLLTWLVNIAEAHYEEKMDKEIPEPIRKLVKLLAKAPVIIEILKVAGNWVGHLISDMAGSSESIPQGAEDEKAYGMGIPGVFLSLLYEIASLPLLKDTGLLNVVNDLYANQKIDLRAEIAIFNMQKLPVIINECLVRGLYLVRHLVMEWQEHDGDLKAMNWGRIVPIGNRTIARMMTIATGTFTAVDLADAAIRTATSGKAVDVASFAANMVLRVNFVGIGRFVIAVGTDITMGIKRSRRRNERIALMGQELALLNAKVFYCQADFQYVFADAMQQQEQMWYAAEDTVATLEEAYETTKGVIVAYCDDMKAIAEKMQNISKYRAGIEQHNPEVRNDVINMLKWGKK